MNKRPSRGGPFQPAATMHPGSSQSPSDGYLILRIKYYVKFSSSRERRTLSHYPVNPLQLQSSIVGLLTVPLIYRLALIMPGGAMPDPKRIHAGYSDAPPLPMDYYLTGITKPLSGITGLVATFGCGLLGALSDPGLLAYRYSG